MAENVVDVTVNDDTLTAETTGTFAPIVAKVDDDVCSVYALAADGKPIASLVVRDKETGTETPVHVSTCAEAVICSEGIPMETHLANLYRHAGDAEAHLSIGEKANLETKAGAQEKATAAKNEAVASASLMAESVRVAAAEDATTKAAAARDAAYKYASDLSNGHTSDKNNPHEVTVEQIGALPATKDATTGCYYYLVNGKKEWINPPMVPGTEYRTTERINGSVVYKKLDANNEVVYRLADESEWKNYRDIIGAASSGYGYGEVMPSYFDPTSLSGILATMPDGSTKQIRLWDREGLKSGEEFVGTLRKYDSEFSVLDVVGSTGSKLIKRYFNGIWHPWMWEDPPMEFGVEYRTTRMHLAETVYVKRVDLGALPASGQKRLTYCDEGVKAVVGFEAFCSPNGESTVNNFPFYATNGATLRAKASCTSKDVIIDAFTDSSANTGWATIWYTKN